jgi:predicted dehydrogenase
MSATAMTALSYSRVLGANERLRLGAIGVGERGRNDMSKFQKNPTVEVAAVCDIYADQIDKAKSMAPQAQTYKDHRKLLEDKSIDMVLIATPDHWHSVTTIDALNAGKDVYVEKPLTLTIEEGPSSSKQPV